jgi:hypothetical protein
VTRGRPIPIDLHGGLELLVGASLMAAPFALGFSTAAVAFAVTIGALLVGLALTTSEPGARGTIPLGAHAAYDSGFGIGLLVAGLGFGIADGYRPLVFFLAAGVLELLLSATTRYAPRRI